MVTKQISLKRLKLAIVKERFKTKMASERRELEMELKQLRSGRSDKLLKRLGRGFVILSKKGAKATERGIVKARKFAEESGANEGLDVRFNSSIPKRTRSKVKRRPKRMKPRASVNNNDFFGVGFGLVDI